MEPHSQVASQSSKDQKAKGTSKADKADVGHKGVRRKAKGKGPKHGKHHTTRTESARATAGARRIDQAPMVPKQEKEVPSTRPPAEPTSQSLPSSAERRMVAFVPLASRPCSEDPRTEDAAVERMSRAERPQEAADHAGPQTLPTGVDEHPVDALPVFHRRRPSSFGKDVPAAASRAVSPRSRAAEAVLKGCTWENCFFVGFDNNLEWICYGNRNKARQSYRSLDVIG